MHQGRLGRGQLGMEPEVGVFEGELRRRWEPGGLREVAWGPGKHLASGAGKKGLGKGSPQ